MSHKYLKNLSKIPANILWRHKPSQSISTTKSSYCDVATRYPLYYDVTHKCSWLSWTWVPTHWDNRNPDHQIWRFRPTTTNFRPSIYHLHIRIPEKNISNFEYLIVLNNENILKQPIYVFNLHVKLVLFNILLPISNLVIVSNVILILKKIILNSEFIKGEFH